MNTSLKAERNSDDIKVLWIGTLCAIAIFTIVSSYEAPPVASIAHIDLVQDNR